MKAAVLLLVIFVTVFSGKVFKMDVKNVGSQKAKMIREGTYPQFLEELYKRRAELGTETGSQPIHDFFDDYYLGTIALGVPVQKFQVMIDTASATLWVVDLACATKPCNGPPYTTFNRTKYDTSISQTYEADTLKFYLQYGIGSIKGHLAVDTLEFGGLVVERQAWGLATHVDDAFGKQPLDGIFGMGWPSLAADNVIPPIQNVLEQLNEPIFTIWLDRRVTPEHGGSAGQITYGAFDTHNCYPVINYVALSSTTYWQFEMDGYAIKDHSAMKKYQTISDTGTAWIGGPQTPIADIAFYVGAEWNLKHAMYVVECAKQPVLPDVVFYILGLPYKIPSIEYVMDVGLGDGKCAIGFFVIEGGGFGPAWIFGDVFIRSFCNVYDVGLKRIGFAEAIHTNYNSSLVL